MFWVWDSVGSVLGVPKKNVRRKNSEFSEWNIFVNISSNYFQVRTYRLSVIKIDTTEYWMSNCKNDHLRFIFWKFFTLISPKLSKFLSDSQVLMSDKWDEKFLKWFWRRVD